MDGRILVVPRILPSIHKSGHNFFFDAPTVWNALPDEWMDGRILGTTRRISITTTTPSVITTVIWNQIWTEYLLGGGWHSLSSFCYLFFAVNCFLDVVWIQEAREQTSLDDWFVAKEFIINVLSALEKVGSNNKVGKGTMILEV